MAEASGWTAAVWGGIIAAGIAAVASIWATYSSNQNALEQQKVEHSQRLGQQKAEHASQLEQQKREHQAQLAQQSREHEARLMLEVVRTDDVSRSRENLRFLLSAGLVSDPDRRIERAINDQTITLPPADGASTTMRNFHVELEGIYYTLLERLDLRWPILLWQRGGDTWWNPIRWTGTNIEYDAGWSYGWLAVGNVAQVVMALGTEMGHRDLGHTTGGRDAPEAERAAASRWAGYAAHRWGLTEAQVSQYYSGARSDQSDFEEEALRGWRLSANGHPLSDVGPGAGQRRE